MNTPNPLQHVGQTAAKEEDSRTPDDQAGDAGAEARQQNQTDEADRKPGQHPTLKPPEPDEPAPAASTSSAPPKAQKEIPDLEPGEAPPESSAGS